MLGHLLGNTGYALEQLAEWFASERKSAWLQAVMWVGLAAVSYLCLKFMPEVWERRKYYLIISSLFFAGALWFLLYMVSYGKPHWQMANPGPYLLAFLLSGLLFFALTFLGYGFGLVAEFVRTGSLNIKGAVAWCGTLLVLMSLWLWLTYGKALNSLYGSESSGTVSTSIRVRVEKGHQAYISEFALKRADGKVVPVEVEGFRYNEDGKDVYTASVVLPRGTWTLAVSWYSFTDGEGYSDEVPFPLHKLKTHLYLRNITFDPMNHDKIIVLMERLPWLASRRAPDLLFVVKPNGAMDLKQADTPTYFWYKDLDTETISEDERQKFRASYERQLAFAE